MAIIETGEKFLREANPYFLAIQELNNSNGGIILANYFLEATLAENWVFSND